MKTQNHENIEKHDEVVIGSEKSFGFVFAGFFAILAFLPMFNDKEPRVTFLAASIILILISMFSPALLSGPNWLWFKLGEVLRRLISPVILAFIFFAVITPLAFFLKIMRKDILELSRDNRTTYWTKLRKSEFNMKDQF